MRKNIKLILILIALFQIFLLINISVSQSYFICQKDNLEKENQAGELIKKAASILVGFLSIKQIGTVSAQVVGCCMENCLGTIEDECDGNWVSTPCSETTECGIGTCIDRNEGTCSGGSAKHICTDDGGEWKDLSIDKIDECQKGCCTLDNGASKKFLKKIECSKQDGSFNPSVSDEDCRIYTQEMGACLLDEGNCRFTTEEDCEVNLNGGFRLGLLCSNPNLETICPKPETESETRTKCYNDKVYFLDSCNNLANVYDSSKWEDDSYWETVQNTSLECEVGSNFNSPSCGNCDGSTSICDSSLEQEGNPDYGSNVCKDLRCIDENGITRQNQESWCVYESHVGGSTNNEFSTDVVGSEYRLRYCDKGEIKTELCGNYRGQVCSEIKIDLDGIGEVSRARCRSNEGFKCSQVEIEYEYNDDGEIINTDEIKKAQEECEDMSDCRVQSVNLYDINSNSFIKFDVCVSKYPPGLDFWNPNGKADDLCSFANIEIPTLWKKSLLGKWECEANCKILNQEFANQMNDLCVSLGDCGGYVNVAGEYTKNFDSFNIVELGGDFKTEDYDADGDIDSDKETEYISYSKSIGEGNLPDYFSSTEKATFGGNSLDDFELEDLDLIIENLNLILASGTAGLGGLVGALAYGSFSNPVTLIAVAIIALLIGVFGKWQTEEVIVSFECQPWQAPIGGEDCELCNNDPLRPCTEYKCKSLGAGCSLIDENELYESENPVCVYKYAGDKIPPQISLDKIDTGAYLVEEESNGLKIRLDDGTEEGGCIQEFSPINFTLKTENEDGLEDYAQCVYNLKTTSLNVPDYELEGEEFKEGNSFSVTHTFEDRLPFVTSLDSADISGDIPGERTGEFNLYVRCRDYSGNSNNKEYLVNLCVKEREDNTIATINEYEPEDRSFLKYEDTSQELTITLDEPAECKWSTEPDKLHDEMNDFDYCFLSKGKTGICITEITGLTASENKVYIKCKDQPWLEGIAEGQGDPWDRTNRNVNTEDFVYTIYSTETPLQISSISPLGDVTIGGNVEEVSLTVETSGGVEGDKSQCKFEYVASPTDSNSRDLFKQYDVSHSYSLNLESGSYDILVTCWDKAGNEDEENALFDLVVDNSAPRIVRAFNENGKLNLITNEDAKCYYSLENCDFDLEEGVSITTAFATEHSTQWKSGVTYHIKCKDLFDNINSDCARRIITSD